MTSSFRCLVALLLSSAATCAIADEPKNVLTVVELAQEAPASSVMFPLSSTSPFMVTPCENCAPVSHAVTAQTRYFINRRQVTLEELRAVVAGKPDLMLTVQFSVKTGDMVRVTADLPQRAAAPARRR